MSLITVHGQNPFDGQKDPYISIDASINYSVEQGAQNTTYSYSLNGVLTGCNSSELENFKNKIFNAFDWKADPSIPQNINIQGIVSSSQGQQLVPQSLSFENSNYIGSLGYTLTLSLDTGEADEVEDSAEEESEAQFENLINKTHTVTTSINEEGCKSESVNISCSPNFNLTGCDTISVANKWIQSKIGKKLGSKKHSSMPLQSESMTINPLTSEVSYQASYSEECGNQTDIGEPQNNDIQGFVVTQCKESNTENPECPNPIINTRYNGEIYKSGVEPSVLLNKLDSLISKHKKVKSLSTNYSAASSKISYSFETRNLEDGSEVDEPVDVELYNTTYSISIDHSESDKKTINANGTLSLLNPVKKTLDDINDKSNEEILGIVKSNSEDQEIENLKLTRQNFDRNSAEGTIGYGFTFETPATLNEDEVGLQGKSGLQSFSINCSPPLSQFNLYPKINDGCEFKIQDLGYPSRGSLSLSVTTVSGSGYDYEQVASEHLEEIKNIVLSNAEDVVIENEESVYSNYNRILNTNLSINYSGKSVIDSTSPNQVLNMF